MNCVLPPNSFNKKVDKILNKNNTMRYKQNELSKSNLSNNEKSSIETLRNEIKHLKSQIFNKSFDTSRSANLSNTQNIQGSIPASNRTYRSKINLNYDNISEDTLQKFKQKVLNFDRDRESTSRISSVQSIKYNDENPPISRRTLTFNQTMPAPKDSLIPKGNYPTQRAESVDNYSRREMETDQNDLDSIRQLRHDLPRKKYTPDYGNNSYRSVRSERSECEGRQEPQRNSSFSKIIDQCGVSYITNLPADQQDTNSNIVTTKVISSAVRNIVHILKGKLAGFFLMFERKSKRCTLDFNSSLKPADLRPNLGSTQKSILREFNSIQGLSSVKDVKVTDARGVLTDSLDCYDHWTQTDPIPDKSASMKDYTGVMECISCGKVQLRVMTATNKSYMSPRFIEKVRVLLGADYQTHRSQAQPSTRSSNLETNSKADYKDTFTPNKFYTKSEDSLRKKVLGGEFEYPNSGDSLKYSQEQTRNAAKAEIVAETANFKGISSMVSNSTESLKEKENRVNKQKESQKKPIDCIYEESKVDLSDINLSNNQTTSKKLSSSKNDNSKFEKSGSISKKSLELDLSKVKPKEIEVEQFKMLHDSKRDQPNSNTNRGLYMKYNNTNTYKPNYRSKGPAQNTSYQQSQVNSRYNSLFNDSSILHSKSVSKLDVTDGSVHSLQLPSGAKDVKPYICESNSDLKTKIKEIENNSKLGKDNSEISYYTKQMQDAKRDLSRDIYLSFDKDCSEIHMGDATQPMIQDKDNYHRFISPINGENFSKTNGHENYGDSTKLMIDELHLQSFSRRYGDSDTKRINSNLNITDKLRYFTQLLATMTRQRLAEAFFSLLDSDNSNKKIQKSLDFQKISNPKLQTQSRNECDTFKAVSFGEPTKRSNSNSNASKNILVSNTSSNWELNENLLSEPKSSQIIKIAKKVNPDYIPAKHDENNSKAEKMAEILDYVKHRIYRSFFEDLYFYANKSKLLISGSEGRLSIQNLSQDLICTSALSGRDRKDTSVVIISDDADLSSKPRGLSIASANASADKFKLSNLNYSYITRSGGSSARNLQPATSDIVNLDSNYRCDSDQAKEGQRVSRSDFGKTWQFSGSKNKSKSNTLYYSAKESKTRLDLDGSSLYLDD